MTQAESLVSAGTCDISVYRSGPCMFAEEHEQEF